MNGNAATVFADAYVNAKGASLAVHDVIGGLSLCGREIMGLFKIGVKSVENILYGTTAAHDLPPSG